MLYSAFPLNPGIPWQTTTTSQVITVGRGYEVNAPGSVTLTLPLTFNYNDIFFVYNYSGHTLFINTNAGQGIQFGDAAASSYLESTTIGDSIALVCFNPNLEFNVINVLGNWNYA